MWLENIKKKLNIQSTEQKNIVSDEYTIVMNFINETQKKWDKRTDDEYQKDKDRFEKSQNTCSVCGSTKIVNKIISQIKRKHLLKSYTEINKLHAESLYKAFDREIPLYQLRCDFKSVFE